MPAPDEPRWARPQRTWLDEDLGYLATAQARSRVRRWFRRLPEGLALAEGRKILIDELGSTPEELFGSFDEEPFAAASTAQVHRATLLDGTPVVVKIQRPNIDVTVKADLNVMNDLALRIQRRQDWAKEIDLRGLVKEFGEGILYELDYRNEASNLMLLTRNMAQFDFVSIPAVYSALSATKVLTMDFVTGVKISDVAAIEEAGIDKGQLAREFVHAMVKQTLFDGFFHADPHPGNVLVNLGTGQIGFLDIHVEQVGQQLDVVGGQRLEKRHAILKPCNQVRFIAIQRFQGQPYPFPGRFCRTGPEGHDHPGHRRFFGQRCFRHTPQKTDDNQGIGFFSQGDM